MKGQIIVAVDKIWTVGTGRPTFVVNMTMTSGEILSRSKVRKHFLSCNYYSIIFPGNNPLLDTIDIDIATLERESMELGAFTPTHYNCVTHCCHGNNIVIKRLSGKIHAGICSKKPPMKQNP